MAVIPLPENNTIFYIDEANLTERSLYAYDSSKAGGYRFVRNYTPNGIVEEANTQAVSGGEVYKSEKSIKDEMRNFTTLNGVVESLNGYYARSTGAFVSNNSYKSIKFTISENTEYYASNDIQGNLTALAIFYDASDNLLGSQLQGLNGVKTTYKRQKLTIPAGQDLITVMIGVNDITKILDSEIVMGDIDTVLAMENNEPTNSTLSTLYNDSVLGRFRWCMEFLKNKYPNSKVLVCAPIYANRPNYEGLLEILRNGEEKIAYFLGFNFERITNNTLFGISNFNYPIYLADTLHPTDLGYKLIGGYLFNKV